MEESECVIEIAESVPAEDNSSSSESGNSSDSMESGSSGSADDSNSGSDSGSSEVNNDSEGSGNETNESETLSGVESSSGQNNDEQTVDGEAAPEESEETSDSDGESDSSSGGSAYSGNITVHCEDCNTTQIEKLLSTVIKHLDENTETLNESVTETIAEYEDRPIWDTPIEEYTVKEGLLLCILLVLLGRWVWDYAKRFF